MLHVRDSGQEIENDSFDKDFNREILWFSGTGRMLDGRDSDQDTAICSFDEMFNKAMVWYLSRTTAGFHGFCSGLRKR